MSWVICVNHRKLFGGSRRVNLNSLLSSDHGFPQDSHRIPTGFPQGSHRIPTGFPQDSHRIPTGSHGEQDSKWKSLQFIGSGLFAWIACHWMHSRDRDRKIFKNFGRVPANTRSRWGSAVEFRRDFGAYFQSRNSVRVLSVADRDRTVADRDRKRKMLF